MANSEFDFVTEKSHPLDLFPEHQFILSERGIHVMATPSRNMYHVGRGRNCSGQGQFREREGGGGIEAIRLCLGKKPTNRRHSDCL